MSDTKKKSRNYPTVLRKKAEALLVKGETVAAVAESTGVPQHTVRYWKSTLLQKKGCPPDERIADAVVFLRVSRKDLMDSIRAGKLKQPSRSDLHMLLALDALEGA